MKKKVIKSLSLLLVMIFVLSFTTIGLADAGGFSGGSDYGGGGSSSDWGSSGSSSWSDNGYSSGGGGGSDMEGFPVIIIIVIIVIFIVSKSNRGGGSGGSGGTPEGGQPTSKNVVDPTELKRKDPNFSTQEFLEKVSNNYVQMQQAWQDKKWDSMRPIMADGIYSQFERQLDDIAKKGWTNYVERITVLGARIVGYRQDNVNDNLTVELRTRIVDYTVEDATGKLISGSKTAEKFMTYEWTMIRSKDNVTPLQDAVKEVHCPSCGAAVAINHSGECEYCGQVITVNDYDWVISTIRGISQVTR